MVSEKLARRSVCKNSGKPKCGTPGTISTKLGYARDLDGEDGSARAESRAEAEEPGRKASDANGIKPRRAVWRSGIKLLECVQSSGAEGESMHASPAANDSEPMRAHWRAKEGAPKLTKLAAEGDAPRRAI